MSAQLGYSERDKKLFDEILEKIPKLAWTYRVIKSIHDDQKNKSFCANMLWYNFFKEIVCDNVGYDTDNKDERFNTSEAYDVVYSKFYNALPNCRNCQCIPR